MTKPKLMVIGPYPPLVGGITSFIVEEVVSQELKDEYQIIKHSTTRSIKKLTYVSHIIDGYLTIKNFLFYIIKMIIKKPYIIHMHVCSNVPFWESGIYWMISKLFNCKFLIHIHGGGFIDFYNKSKGKILIKFLLKHFDLIIVTSDWWKNQYTKISKEFLIDVLNNPVNTNKYYFSRDKINKKDKKINFLFVGRRWKVKGVDDILLTITKITKKRKDIHFTIIGNDNIREIDNIKVYIKKAKNLNIEKYVTLKSFIKEKEKQRLYRESDIFILPSYNEAFPIVILEAMASGLPIISTRVGAIPEIIEENVNGWLFNPGDIKKMESIITNLNRNNIMHISKNNLNKIRKYYSKDIIFLKLKKIFKKIS